MNSSQRYKQMKSLIQLTLEGNVGQWNIITEAGIYLGARTNKTLLGQVLWHH